MAPLEHARAARARIPTVGCRRICSDITALVPARDEAQLIGRTIAGLLRQGRRAADRRRRRPVEGWHRRHRQDRWAATRCTVIAGAPLPGGWVGKLWALEQGRSAVQTPLTLLIDADIELRPGLVSALLGRLRRDDRSLVSLMAVLEMRSAWEKLLVPAFVYFFKLLYPFRLANASGRSVAAAAGGCVLVESAMLDAHRRVRRTPRCADRRLHARTPHQGGGRPHVDRLDARRREPPAHGFAARHLAHGAAIGLRAAPLLRDPAWLCALGCSPSRSGCRPLPSWLETPVSARSGSSRSPRWSITYMPTLWFYRRSPLWALALPITGTLYLLMTISSAVRYWRGSGAAWKGQGVRARRWTLDAGRWKTNREASLMHAAGLMVSFQRPASSVFAS